LTVPPDALSKEKRCGNKVIGYDLSSTFKENIIIRLRLLFKRQKFQNNKKSSTKYKKGYKGENKKEYLKTV